MKLNFKLLAITLLFINVSFSQTTIANLISQVSQPGIIQTVRDLSGEDSTVVTGNTVLIEHRVSDYDNNLAADYIKEQLTSYGLSVAAINYSANGRNIVATKIGNVNPNDIYLISAHYDAVSYHGADDNASGVAAVLEAARIMANYDFENTVVFALWDEEEIGLKGAENYANTASQNNDNILGVVNMDMIGYDGDNDKLFDIDVRNYANSNQIASDLVNIVSTHNLDLVSNIVNPGTLDSDHSTFWDAGYSAVLLGEAWSENDITPGYHSANDRINLFNYSYFFNMVKLCVGYITTKAVLLNTTAISPTFTPLAKIYPNPTKGFANLYYKNNIHAEINIINTYGNIVFTRNVNGNFVKLDLTNLSNGIYIIKTVESNGSTSVLKMIKEN
ncbi:MAG: M20/M25/M40 family metallo-hydrolase [Flavobacteriales bacterium]|nr:M20/M25/M40 family metallo-hydrolase [Flavobacteriales bacterium]MCB9364077.1 M20/M25/M40 family metallo-hydrolase [Flavobacteriales bacterium]